MDINVDYKKQVMITDIKSDMQCSIWQVLSNKCEIRYKKWPIKPDLCILSQLTL